MIDLISRIAVTAIISCPTPASRRGEERVQRWLVGSLEVVPIDRWADGSDSNLLHYSVRSHAPRVALQ
jgi:hypothetical protein